MTHDAMKPCPFCGEKGYVCKIQEGFDPGCHECGATLYRTRLFNSAFKTEAAAIAAWNTRAPDDAHEALVAALDTALRYIEATVDIHIAGNIFAPNDLSILAKIAHLTSVE